MPIQRALSDIVPTALWTREHDFWDCEDLDVCGSDYRQSSDKRDLEPNLKMDIHG